jgi:hypothetical protein
VQVPAAIAPQSAPATPLGEAEAGYFASR